MRDYTTITDIHAHILPGIDDGPRDLEETERLLVEMASQGVTRAFCTSHYRSPHFDVTQDMTRQGFELTQVHLSKRTLDIRTPELSLGAEVRIGTPLEEDIRNNSIPTLGNTSYVLIEFPTVELPKQAFDLVHEINVRGLRPILAHPERYVSVQKDPGIVDELLSMGVYMQLTAWCFLKTGKEMHAPDKLAWELLGEGKAHLIASDAHNITTRPPVLQAAYEAIRERLGDDVVNQLIGNANAVWEDENCLDIAVEVRKKKSKGLFSFFSRSVL